METRTRILEAAADLLSRSPDADVSTRDVCEAAGVAAPALYRQFGDKEGLLSAVVDFGFEQYLAGKRAAQPSDDPVQDLRDGWDNHVAFALEHPNYYRLMWSPGLRVPPQAAAEAHRLLLDVCERCAVVGRLTAAAETAAKMIMSANAGVALSLISRPAIYTDERFSARVRDAVIDSVTLPRTAAGRRKRAAADAHTEVSLSAATLAARLRAQAPGVLHPAEQALLQLWLERLADGAERGAERQGRGV